MTSREERRALLLEAAKVVVLRHGYRKANLGDVALEAGVSRATVYNYFPSKEALFQGIVAQEMDRLRAAVASELDFAAAPDRVLLDYVRARRKHIKRIKDFYLLTLNVTRDLMTVVQGELDSFQAQERAFLAGLLRAGLAAGLFRSFDPDLMAAALLSALRGLHEDYFFDSQEDFAQGAEVLMTALLMGLLREPGDGEIDVGRGEDA